MMLNRLFSGKKKKKKASASATSSMTQSRETLEMLEKREDDLQKKISQEVQKAKDYAKLKNKKAAIQCLQKKKSYEAQLEHIRSSQLKVHEQMIAVQGATAATDVIDSLKASSAAVKSLQKSLNSDKINKTMEEASKEAENLKDIQDALVSSIGAAADFDEDELEAELEELEEAELEEHEAQPVEPPSSTAPAPSLMSQNVPKRQSSISAASVGDLADRQTEMAL